jgi:hypothetical protein
LATHRRLSNLHMWSPWLAAWPPWRRHWHECMVAWRVLLNVKPCTSWRRCCCVVLDGCRHRGRDVSSPSCSVQQEEDLRLHVCGRLPRLVGVPFFLFVLILTVLSSRSSRSLQSLHSFQSLQSLHSFQSLQSSFTFACPASDLAASAERSCY